MASFEYFGIYYEIADDNNSVILRWVPSATGNIFIPKEVEYNNKKYPVIGIGGFKLEVFVYGGGIKETDGRKKNYWRVAPNWSTDHFEGVSPFTLSNGKATDFDKQIIPNTTITAVKLPTSIKYLGEAAFRRCYALEEVELSKAITKIPFRCFSGCRSLKSIQLHEGITEIGDYAFIGCTALTEITIPSTVTKIGDLAFGDSTQAQSGLKVVNILNDEGEVMMYPNSFTDRVKINYLGKKAAKKTSDNKPAKESATAKATAIDLEKLIQAALADGTVTDKERAILIKKVKEAGGDTDEFEMLLDARIFEATKKNAKVEKTTTEAKTAPKEKPATKTEKPAQSTSTGGMTVGTLTAAFKSQFGAVLRIYNGRSKADDSISLQDVGLTQEISTSFDGKQKVGDFIAQMANVGLKVKVYTSDEWVAVLDSLSLEQAGKVKKNATKADMEKML